MQSTTPVLQSTDPALLCSTKYHSMRQSITPVLQSTTPVLLCTTPVLQSFAPVPKCYEVPLGTGKFCSRRSNRCHLSLSNLTKYCACHQNWFSWLWILVTFETSFTMRGARDINHQPHQILRLPRKISWLILLPSMTPPWSEHDPTMTRPCNWKNIAFRAPAIIPDFTKYCAYHEKWPLMDLPPKMSRTIDPERSFTIKRSKDVTLQPHQILRLPRNMTLPKCTKNFFRCGDDPSVIRSQPREIFVLSANIFYGNIKGFALRLPFQISSNTATATKSDARISPNSAPATKRDLRTSPNNAHATKRTLELHRVLHLPAKVTPDSSIVDSIAWLYYDLTILLLDSTIAWQF